MAPRTAVPQQQPLDLNPLQQRVVRLRAGRREGTKEALPAAHKGQVNAPAVAVGLDADREPPLPLPIWGDKVRGVPNAILRSAIFGVIKRGDRTNVKRTEIASYGDVSILFSGTRLDQSDLDVWEHLLHLASICGNGNTIKFNAHSFLTDIKRDSGRSQYIWLAEVFARLAGAVVEITEGRRTVFGAMISGGARDEDKQEYAIKINPEIAKLYYAGGWSRVEWQQRLKLQGKPLALWLHGFYSTHRQPFALKTQTLHSLCGSGSKHMNQYRRELRTALRHVGKATGWNCEIDSADLIQIAKYDVDSA